MGWGIQRKSWIPLSYYQCSKCRKHCYGGSPIYVRVVGDDVEYVGRHGPYCGDCFDRGITVSVPVVDHEQNRVTCTER